MWSKCVTTWCNFLQLNQIYRKANRTWTGWPASRAARGTITSFKCLNVWKCFYESSNGSSGEETEHAELIKGYVSCFYFEVDRKCRRQSALVFCGFISCDWRRTTCQQYVMMLILVGNNPFVGDYAISYDFKEPTDVFTDEKRVEFCINLLLHSCFRNKSLLFPCSHVLLWTYRVTHSWIRSSRSGSETFELITEFHACTL